MSLGEAFDEMPRVLCADPDIVDGKCLLGWVALIGHVNNVGVQLKARITKGERWGE